MVLNELENDKCPWKFRDQEPYKEEINFALCHDCPMMKKLEMFGESSNKKTHAVKVECEKEEQH